jgi:uncharacterized protein
MNVTFDTNVLLSATLWNNSVAQKVLFMCIRKDITIYSSPFILKEYQNVLKRDFDFSEEEIAECIQKILLCVNLIDPEIQVDIVKDDPDDNSIIECALVSLSKYILTYDKHLLIIKEYNGIKIIKPEEARLIFNS